MAKEGTSVQASLGNRQRQRVEGLRSKTVQLRRDTGEAVTTYRDALERAGRGQEVDFRQQAASLDGALERNKALEGDMQVLIADLTGEFEELGSNIAATKDYRGARERALAALHLYRLANRLRVERIRRQKIDGSVRTILAYTEGVIEALGERIEATTHVYQNLQGDLEHLTAKLKDCQPKYEHWAAEHDRLEGEMEDLARRLAETGPSERPQLEEQRRQLQLELDQAELNRNTFFTIVKEAQEALPILRHHMEGYKQTISAVNIDRTQVEEMMTNYTNVFVGMYELMQTALEVRGFEKIHQTLRFALDKFTEALNLNVESITNTTIRRSQMEAIDRPKLEDYHAMLKETSEKMDAAMREREERYRVGR